MVAVLVTGKHGTPEGMSAPSLDQGHRRLGPSPLFCVLGTWAGSEFRVTEIWLCCENAGVKKQQFL